MQFQNTSLSDKFLTVYADNMSWNMSETVYTRPEPLFLFEAIIFIMLSSFCICSTVIGNILVILSVFTYRALKCVPNFFIVSLAIADLAVAILVMPFNVANYVLGRWTFGSIFCHAWLTFDILTCTASILNLCAIALDRYYAIHDPINYAQKRTMRRVLVTIAVVWVASAVISVPPIIGWNDGLYNPRTRVCELTDQRGYVIYSASGSFYIPLLIMTFVYINIFVATRRRLRKRAMAAVSSRVTTHTCAHATVTKKGSNSSSEEEPAPLNGSAGKANNRLLPDGSSPSLSVKTNQSSIQVHQFLEEKQRISLSKERRAARTLGIIMGVFVLCWLPFFIMYVVCAFEPSCKYTDRRVVNFIVWLGYINSSLNPVIYTIFNIDFRRAFKRLLQGKCKL